MRDDSPSVFALVALTMALALVTPVDWHAVSAWLTGPALAWLGAGVGVVLALGSAVSAGASPRRQRWRRERVLVGQPAYWGAT